MFIMAQFVKRVEKLAKEVGVVEEKPEAKFTELGLLYGAIGDDPWRSDDFGAVEGNIGSTNGLLGNARLPADEEGALGDPIAATGSAPVATYLPANTPFAPQPAPLPSYNAQAQYSGYYKA